MTAEVMTSGHPMEMATERSDHRRLHIEEDARKTVHEVAGVEHLLTIDLNLGGRFR
jgi:hypothetical protein